MKNGLKGVTDATVFCKSMQKGGPAPMIRSMKSYELGGVTENVGLTDSNTNKPPNWLKKIKRNINNAKLKMQQNVRNHRCTGAGCVE